MIKIQNFINNSFCDSIDQKTIDSINPATEEIIATLADSSKEDVEKAVRAAKDAFPTWSNLSAKDRSDYLYRIAELIETHCEELALCESIDQGKPFELAKTVDIPRAALNFRFFAGAILHDESAFHQSSKNVMNYTIHSGVGVAGLISPWNLPLYLLTWKIAPAIAYGNTCVAKASEFTSLTAFKLCELILQSGLPKGVVNLVFGYGHKVGEALTAHKDVPLISFTGGTETGKKVYKNAIDEFKKVSLELGGKNPSVIFDDCDYDKALNTTVRSAFTNQGEICLCGSRIYVQESLETKFIEDFVSKVKRLKVGDPLDTETNLGAIVSKAHFEKVLSYIDKARKLGGKILCGGNAIKVSGKGYFIEATVIHGLDQSCEIIQDEIFGPVVTISSFKDEEEAIRYSNDSKYGLAANIWTKDINRIKRVSDALNFGIVWVNTWMNRDLRTPFGGMKYSGVGREGGAYSRNFFSKTKNVCIETSDLD